MNTDSFFKPRLSKFNHFAIKCPNCYLRMTVVISYNKEENRYYPIDTPCRVCFVPIPITVTPVAIKIK